MTEAQFHILGLLIQFVGLLIQLVGLGYLIFKAGRWIGEAMQNFKALFRGHEEIKHEFAKHSDDDDRRFEKLMDRFTDMQISDTKERNRQMESEANALRIRDERRRERDKRDE